MKARSTLIVLTAISILAGSGISFSQTQQELREAFHFTYPLTANGQIELRNITGNVSIRAWDRDEVKIDVVKRAYSEQRLAEAEVKIEAAPGAIHIKTHYPYSTTTWTDKAELRHNNPASVEYSLNVPRGASLYKVELINGSLDIEGLAGNVDLSCINGVLSARQLGGAAKLSTINGSLAATFDRLARLQTISLNSINGNIELIISSGVNADIKASTLHGEIVNDFGFAVRRSDSRGGNLGGMLGDGSAPIILKNVNGNISIRRAS